MYYYCIITIVLKHEDRCRLFEATAQHFGLQSCILMLYTTAALYDSCLAILT